MIVPRLRRSMGPISAPILTVLCFRTLPGGYQGRPKYRHRAVATASGRTALDRGHLESGGIREEPRSTASSGSALQLTYEPLVSDANRLRDDSYSSAHMEK